jgi:hypothetical protein
LHMVMEFTFEGSDNVSLERKSASRIPIPVSRSYERAWSLPFAFSLDLVVPVDASVVFFHVDTRPLGMITSV